MLALQVVLALFLLNCIVQIKGGYSFRSLFAANGDGGWHGELGAEDPYVLEPEWQWAQDVSIVYTWVNGTEEQHSRLRVQYGGSEGSSERDRDIGDLRYSLRSLYENMPWHTGTIYLVSPPGHIPSWLNTDHPRLQWINQNDIVPEEFQPTFNSNCIEQFMHRIPGITERFVHFNDDYLVRKFAHPSVFFTQEGGLNLYLERFELGLAKKRQGDGQWVQQVHATDAAVDGAYGEIYHWKTRNTEHAPYVYSKKSIEGVHERFGDILRSTASHHFRHEEDVLFPMLHHAWVLQEGSRCCGIRFRKAPGLAKFMRWTADLDENETRWQKVENATRYYFSNCNDDMGSGAEAVAAAQQLLGKLVAKFPEASPFER